jgi:hypothetical protein
MRRKGRPLCRRGGWWSDACLSFAAIVCAPRMDRGRRASWRFVRSPARRAGGSADRGDQPAHAGRPSSRLHLRGSRGGHRRPSGFTAPMTSATDALIGLAIGSLIVPRVHTRAYLITGALCAIPPDLDLLAPYFGGDRDVHRRLTHSVFFAGLLGMACGLAASHSRFRGRSVRLGTAAAFSARPRGLRRTPIRLAAT